jgi:HEAT repeat protein
VLAAQRRDTPLLAAVIGQAADPDPVIREWAAEALGAFDDLSSVEATFGLVLDADSHVRQAARKVLVEKGRLVPGMSTRSLRPLIAHGLGDENWNRRHAAVLLLQEIGGAEVVAPLARSVADPHSVVRSAAQAALRAVDPNWAQTAAARDAVPRLLAMLRSKADPAARLSAVEALGAIGDDRATDALLHVLCDEDLAGRPRQALRRIDRHWARGEAALAQIPTLLRGLAEADLRIAYSASRALEAFRPDWPQTPDARAQVPALIARLPQGPEWQRTMIARALGKLADERAIPRLFEALYDQDPRVAEEAGLALDAVKLDRPRQDSVRRAVPRIAEELRPDSPPNRRLAAMALLARTAEPSAVGLLEPLLAEHEPLIVAAAASSLGRIGAPRAIGPLVALLRRPELEVRRAAGRALRRIEGPRAATWSRLRLYLSHARTPGEVARAIMEWAGVPPFG